jgi:hypothetical protein
MRKQIVVQPPEDGRKTYLAFVSDEVGTVVLHGGSAESEENDTALGAIRNLALRLSDELDAKDAPRE